MGIKEEVQQFLREKLEERMSYLYPDQRTFLVERVYPHGIPDSKIEDAINLCDRTIKKNRDGRFTFLYLFNDADYGKFRAARFPDNYLQIEGGEPAPLEDYGDYLLSTKDMGIQEAYQVWVDAQLEKKYSTEEAV